MLNSKHSNLYHGHMVLSARLKLFLIPTAYLFRTSVKPLATPLKALLVPMVVFAYWSTYKLNMWVLATLEMPGQIMELIKSEFVIIMYTVYTIYRLSMSLVIFMIILVNHQSIKSLLNTHFCLITKKKQAQFARTTFYINLLRTFIKCSFVVPVFYPDWMIIGFGIVAVLMLDQAISTPIMYIQFICRSVGEHTENFSKLFVEPMFDQFIKPEAPQMPRRGSVLSTTKSLSSAGTALGYLAGLGELRRTCGEHLMDIFHYFRHRLNSHHYHELPQMKMTKLTTENSRLAMLNDSTWEANHSLIRMRLRRTQVMLGELRDLMQDIDRVSAPVTLLEFIHDSFVVVMVTTCLVQLKFYRTFHVISFFYFGSILNLTILVYYTCTSLDKSVSELQLMINKLFDFIIMSHRGGHDSKSNEIITETWSQFQYVRQLSETIRLTLGGHIPISRRVVLIVFAHVLSAAFITIEAMNIIDTRSPEQIH